MKISIAAVLAGLAVLCSALESRTIQPGIVETTILPGETFTIEAEVPGKTVSEVPTLFFVARLKGKLDVSANHVMRIAADGVPLKELIRDIPRIVNRSGKTFHGTRHAYTRDDCWNVAANLNEDYIEIIHVPEDYVNVYVYELDISDLNPGKHKFSWTNRDPERPLLINMPKVQSRAVIKTPYAPLRAFQSAAAAEILSIDADNGTAAWKFMLPARKGFRRVLRIRTRLNSGSGWGYNGNLKMMLNGALLGHTMKNGGIRIFNRTNEHFMGNRFHPAINWRGDYCVIHHGNGDMEERFKRFPSAEEMQNFWGYLDLSDLLNGDGENVLTFSNTAKSGDFRQRAGNPRLIIELCEAGYVSEKAMEMLPADEKRKAAPGKTLKKAAYTLSVAEKTFGLQLRRGGELFFIDTALSYPRGGMNSLYCPGAQCGKPEAEWKPLVKVDGDTILLEAGGRHYTFQRKIICEDSAIRVRDTIRSLSSEVLGVVYRNALISGSSPKTVYKHGARHPVTPWKGNHRYPATNSTMFIQLEKGGLGLFVEDDLFKLQCDYSVRGNLLGFKTEHLGFAPGASHTLEWSLYPLPEGDYFDFINKVRGDLGINNQTIPGAILWPGAMKNDEVKKRYMDNLGLKIPALYWFDYDACEVQNASMEERLAPCVREYHAFKKWNPELRPIFMWQNNYTRCNYRGMPMFFPDSCVVDPNGKMVEKGVGWRSGKNGYFTERYFHLDNSYYRYAMEVIPRMLELDVTGVYFDTPNHIQESYSRFTYDRWDNCTVDIDPETYTVTRRYADLCLISGPARINIARLITGKGKYAYYNNPPLLNEMIRMPNCVFMIEGDVDLQLAALHLTLPLCFGEHADYNDPARPLYGRRKTWLGAEDFMDDIRWKIQNGVLYNVYAPPLGKKGEKISSAVLDHEYPLAYMYPITPTDLHAGWIRGKERIITIHSGTFGWEGAPVAIELRLFDRAGRAAGVEQTTSSSGMFPVRVPEKGMAILIRK